MAIEDDPILRHLLCKQVTHLHFDIPHPDRTHCWLPVTNIFTIVLSLCERLVQLEFNQYIGESARVTPGCFLVGGHVPSSSLTKLKITVANIYDCLLLLDGRLESLSILLINVASIFDATVELDEQVSWSNQSHR